MFPIQPVRHVAIVQSTRCWRVPHANELVPVLHGLEGVLCNVQAATEAGVASLGLSAALLGLVRGAVTCVSQPRPPASAMSSAEQTHCNVGGNRYG